MFIERMFRPTKGKGFAMRNHTLGAYAKSLNAVAQRNSDGACKVRCLEPYLQDVAMPPEAELPSPLPTPRA
ncbi:lipase [Trypanosoma grayi]|uniref:lipase n=1 Tax=Trypanosoma grayi TaxID=71804 RepID=UPI0004F467DC|nr:lipase [Trypanosoma grayi]KEG14690.1 lipase [Trypanosoma grayi]